MLKDGLKRGSAVSGSPSEVKVTAQVTDQAATRPGLRRHGQVDNVAPRRRAWNCKGAGADDTYNKAEIGDDNSVTAKVTLSLAPR
ncbi:hypothetical protein C0708_00040 [Aeromonas caviae]|nr:hypothetical protein C0708_00040 [Aeromonas caviae]